MRPLRGRPSRGCQLALARGAPKLQLTDLISHRAETHHPCHSMVDVAVDESESLGPQRLTVLRIDSASRRAQMIPCSVLCVTYEAQPHARSSIAFESASCRRWCFRATEIWHQTIVGRAKVSASEDAASRTAQPLRSAQNTSHGCNAGPTLAHPSCSSRREARVVVGGFDPSVG